MSIATNVQYRNSPQQMRAHATLTKLQTAAKEILDEVGRDRLTTAMVAERAGVSIGTFYRYYDDRIAVLEDIQPISGGLDLFIQDYLPIHKALLDSSDPTDLTDAYARLHYFEGFEIRLLNLAGELGSKRIETVTWITNNGGKI